MKEIWTQEEAEFHGEFVNFDRIWSHPKPVQKPHPPILMGGDGPTTFDRVVEFADGWMPLARSGRNPAEKIGLLRQRARSEEHTSELQSRLHLVCRLLLEKKKT